MNPADLGAGQRRLLQTARGFLSSMTERGVDVARDPECFLNSWANGPGHARLRCMAFGWREQPGLVVARAKDTIGWFRLAGFEIAGTDARRPAFESLIVSWARRSDFEADGTYLDRYTRLSSAETPRTLWFLISLDGVLPKTLQGNIRVFHRPSSARRLGFGTVGFRGGPVVGRSRSRPSATTAHATAIAIAVSAQLQMGNYRRVLMPYEAQPFQHAVNLAVKDHDSGISTVGYLHSVLPALPTEMTYRIGAPDRLLVHGTGQKEIVTRYLGWPNDRVDVIPSLRYRDGDDAPLSGRMLLPYALHDEEVLLNAVEDYLRQAPAGSLPRWQVRNHPVRATSRSHAAFASRLEALCDRYSDRMSEVPPGGGQTLIVGATAAVIEALERGLDVIHVCANPLFETQTSEIWADLHVEALSSHVYRYRLSHRGRYIALGRADEPAAAHLGIA